MNTIQEIAIPRIENLTMTVTTGRLSLRGTIATREPSRSIGVYFKELHAAIIAERVRTFVVDVSELTFVNSSAIRLFIDWAMWLNQLPATARYRLTFATSRHVTWQATNFSALRSLVGDVVFVEQKDGTAA
ncbi:MAG: hypothetical protein QM784_09205 [Polyangiaceae bacterium]